MKRLLLNNWVLKLLALLAAIVTWLVVVNVNDPQISHSINNVPVTVVNDQVFADNDMAYWITEGMTVNIRVNNIRQTMVKQLAASDFKLTADCTNWHPGFLTIPIEAEVVNNKSCYQNSEITLSSAFVKIQAEPLQSRMMKVELRQVGVPAEGYTLGNMACSPEQVEVKAPESVMKLLKQAVAHVKVKDAMGDVQEVSELILYDGNGEAIRPEDSRITLSDSGVYVSAEILKTKTVPVVVTNVTGQPAAGYRYTEANCPVSSITIAGSRSALSGISGVILDSPLLNVEGASENVHVSLNIADFLPDTVRLVEPASGTAEVELSVEPLTEKKFTVPSRNIQVLNQEKTFGYHFPEDFVTVTVMGLTEDLEFLAESQLELSVDAEKLTPGTHTVPVRVSLQDIYALKDITEITLEVREVRNGPEEQEE